MKGSAMLAAVAVAAVGVIAVGCGGGGSDSISKSEFLTKGNEICKKGNEEVQAAVPFKKGQQPTTAEISSFVTGTVIPNTEGQINDLRNLGYPDGDKDTLNAIYDDAQKELDTLKSDPTSLSGKSFTDVNQRLIDYGLTECGSNQ
jgi:hypothetical protein